jgi:thiol-disulfide isomerase/thioredoxin
MTKGFIVVMALIFAVGAASVQAAPVAGEAPPDLLGRNPQGQEVRISDHRGKVVVVTFWASWCGYCLKEMPVLEGLQRAVGRERMEVVAVNLKEHPRTYRAILRQLKDVGLTMTHDRDGAIAEAYGVEAVPRLFMVDKAGRLAYVHSGYSEAALPKIVDAANALLRAPAPSATVGPVDPTTAAALP